MYRIAILTNDTDIGYKFAEWTTQFYENHHAWPVITIHEDKEHFWAELLKNNPDGVIIALPNVAGLNAAEHLRSLRPDCGLIWCSDLDFALHAYKLRAEYFLKMPVTMPELHDALSVWTESRSIQRSR